MPVSSRNIIPFTVVAGIVLLTVFNVRLYRKASVIRAHNRALILQQDSIRSVHLNLTREMLDFPERPAQIANGRESARQVIHLQPEVLDN